MSKNAPKKSAKNMIFATIIGLVVVAVFGVVWMTSPREIGYPIEPTGAPVTKETRIGLSTRLQVKKDGKWYKAMVKRVNKDGTFNVHYDGWESRYDENVKRSRMRLAPVPPTP